MIFSITLKTDSYAMIWTGLITMVNLNLAGQMFLKDSNLNLVDLDFVGFVFFNIPMCHDSATKLKVVKYL